MTKLHIEPASAQTLTASTMETVKQHYTILNPIAVQNYLAEKPFLVPLLLEAVPHFHTWFAGDELALEVVFDKDSDATDFAAFPLTTLPALEARHRLERLREDWWLEAMDRSQQAMFITVEFK